MKSQHGSTVILPLVLIVIIVGAGLLLEQASCSGKWENSGLKSDWGPIKGCMVNLPDGRWLPEENVREIDLKVK